MTLGQRCDEIIRLIDEALQDDLRGQNDGFGLPPGSRQLASLAQSLSGKAPRSAATGPKNMSDQTGKIVIPQGIARLVS